MIRKWPQSYTGARVYTRCWDIFFFHGKGCKALEQAAQGSDRVTIPESILRNMWMWYLRTWFSGEHSGCWLMVGLDDLRVLFQL